MSAAWILTAAVAVLLVVLAVWAVLASNALIYKRNRIGQCRSGINIVLKQRNDLIPNLVGAVKAYMVHESELLARITEMRSQALQQSEAEAIASGVELSALLSRLHLAVEHYPELKADRQFLALQEQLVDMERELQAVRRMCNAAIVDYNNAIEQFPSSLIASWRNHTPEALIEMPASELQPIRVAELFGK